MSNLISPSGAIGIPLPAKFSAQPLGENTERITIEPCYPGYGLTLGNALRRVLLSSIPGAAATTVKFDGVTHEFTTTPHVKEDVLEIILNIKKIRFRLFGDEPVTLRLEAKGKGRVKAKDIAKHASVEIVNPNAHLATLTDAKAELACTLIVERGRGYVPVEMRGEQRGELGEIAIDAIFTPVLSVALSTENVRVGQMTNFDRIILDVKTDGTMSPLDAVKESAVFLIAQFQAIHTFGNTHASQEAEPKASSDEVRTEAAGEAAKVLLAEGKKEKKAKEKKGKE